MRTDNNWNLQTSSYWRCLRVALLLFAMQLCAVTHMMAEDRVVVSDLKINPGTTQTLAIQLENAVPYSAFQVEIYFPEGISPVMTDGKYNVRLSSSRKTDKHSISANLVSDGGLKVLSYSFPNTSYSGTSGDLFEIDIVSESTFKGPASIVLKDAFFTRSSDRKELLFADTHCVAFITPYVIGDADGDHQRTFSDAVAVVNYVMGSPSQNFNSTLANVTGDFDEHAKPKVTVTDAVRIILMLNGDASAPKQDMKEPEVEP